MSLQAVVNHGTSSICDGDYSGALRDLGNLVAAQLVGGCIPRKLTNRDEPDCVVEDVTRNANGSTTVVQIRRCGAPGAGLPCWKIEAKAACATRSPEGVGMTIERGGKPALENTETGAVCATTS